MKSTQLMSPAVSYLSLLTLTDNRNEVETVDVSCCIIPVTTDSDTHDREVETVDVSCCSIPVTTDSDAQP